MSPRVFQPNYDGRGRFKSVQCHGSPANRSMKEFMIAVSFNNSSTTKSSF